MGKRAEPNIKNQNNTLTHQNHMQDATHPLQKRAPTTANNATYTLYTNSSRTSTSTHTRSGSHNRTRTKRRKLGGRTKKKRTHELSLAVFAKKMPEQHATTRNTPTSPLEKRARPPAGTCARTSPPSTHTRPSTAYHPRPPPTADHTYSLDYSSPDSPAFHAGLLKVVQRAADAAQLTSVGV